MRISVAEADEIVGDLLEAGLALAVCRESVGSCGSAGMDEATDALDRALRALQLVTLASHDGGMPGPSARAGDGGCREATVQAARRMLGHVARQLDAVAQDHGPGNHTVEVIDAARSTSRAMMALDQAR